MKIYKNKSLFSKGGGGGGGTRRTWVRHLYWGSKTNFEKQCFITLTDVALLFKQHLNILNHISICH